MPITVGQDSAKTRQTLTAGSQSIAYYSIPAAQAAGLGDFAKLPAALPPAAMAACVLQSHSLLLRSDAPHLTSRVTLRTVLRLHTPPLPT
ncbi:MAG: hypothetical protein VX181_16830, partial [Pseudomonadota bacterium]|nr:hypothetical protein [Pseudomonadota bacterium]